MYPEQLAIRQWLSKAVPCVGSGGCCCIGPQNGEPLCGRMVKSLDIMINSHMNRLKH